jgi:hypothetical protein
VCKTWPLSRWPTRKQSQRMASSLSLVITFLALICLSPVFHKGRQCKRKQENWVWHSHWYWWVANLPACWKWMTLTVHCRFGYNVCYIVVEFCWCVMYLPASYSCVR